MKTSQVLLFILVSISVVVSLFIIYVFYTSTSIKINSLPYTYQNTEENLKIQTIKSKENKELLWITNPQFGSLRESCVFKILGWDNDNNLYFYTSCNNYNRYTFRTKTKEMTSLSNSESDLIGSCKDINIRDYITSNTSNISDDTLQQLLIISPTHAENLKSFDSNIVYSPDCKWAAIRTPSSSMPSDIYIIKL